jgi:hypothetical protein
MQLSSIRHAGQVRSRGFSCREVGATPEAGSYPETPLRLGQLGFAVGASVALASKKHTTLSARSERTPSKRTAPAFDDDDIEALDRHAIWQVPACRAI